MSVDKNTYLIYGYDLTDYREDLISEEFYDSEVYDELCCCKRQGQIQAFCDPMCGGYLYVGYIAAVIRDGYEDYSYIMSDSHLAMEHMVKTELDGLDLGDKWKSAINKAYFSIILFNEFT